MRLPLKRERLPMESPFAQCTCCRRTPYVRVYTAWTARPRSAAAAAAAATGVKLWAAREYFMRRQRRFHRGRAEGRARGKVEARHVRGELARPLLALPPRVRVCVPHTRAAQGRDEGGGERGHCERCYTVSRSICPYAKVGVKRNLPRKPGVPLLVVFVPRFASG